MELLVYLDEAGHSRNTDTVVVAGLAGAADRWVGFDDEWTATLGRAGVNVFHMKDFENRRGEFEDWDELRIKRPFMAELTEIILRRNLVAVGTAISVKWFKGLDRGEYPDHEFFEDPYHLALQDVFHILGQEVGPHESATSIAVILAQQPEYQAQGRGYYAATAALVYPESFVPTVTYAPASVEPRLQAADLVAYELRKACDNPSVQRWPMRQIRCNSHVFTSKGLNVSQVFGVEGSRYPQRHYVMKIKRDAWPKGAG